jgi:hypothetical protein
MDLLGRGSQEAGDEGAPDSEDQREPDGREAPALLLAGVPSSLMRECHLIPSPPDYSRQSLDSTGPADQPFDLRVNSAVFATGHTVARSS